MDQQRFDAALRALQAGTTRRAGLAGMLSVLLGGVGAEFDAAAKGRGRARDTRGASPRRGRGSAPGVAGPCGDGTARDNRCASNGDCCTKYCANGACRCKPNWMRCRRGSQCCSGNCVGRRCDGGAKPAGSACTHNFNCESGLICSGGVCTPSTTAKCTRRNCKGCCEGTTCRTGKTRQGCGVKAEACDVCLGTAACVEGKCGGSGSGGGGGAGGATGCSAATCADGCCQNGTCRPGDQPDACGADGEACEACAEPTPLCREGVCSPHAWENVASFGSQGTGPGNFKAPNGVALSTDGLTLWVADTANHRISVWTRLDAASTDWSPQTTFGSGPSSGASNFDNPQGVSVTSDGLTVAVADRSRISIWKRQDTSANATNWSNQAILGTTQGTNDDQFQNCYGVFISADGLTVWGADPASHRVSVWTRTDTSSNWTHQANFGTSGTGGAPGQLKNPSGVFASANGLTAWVADRTNSRISVWTRADVTTNAAIWSEQTTFGGQGSAADKLNGPTGVAVSADELTAWIADFSNGRISIWARPDTTTNATSWANETTFGVTGSGEGGLIQPFSLAVAGDELNVWVADSGNSRISAWTYF